MSSRRVVCVGAVVGLAIERAILRARSTAFQAPADLWILTAGASAARAELLAETLISRGATGLISFGIAAGLDPALRPGAVVLAQDVVGPDGMRFATDSVWRDKVATAIGGMALRGGTMAGTDHMLATIEQKRELHQRTAAVAADMESHGVARAAARRSVPFLVVRAVADPADRVLPPGAVAGLDATGAVRPSGTVTAILSDPLQIPALVGIAADALVALTALWRFAGRSGRALAPG